MDSIFELPAGLRPFIQPGVRITCENDSVSLATQQEIYQVQGEDARALARLLPLLDGTKTLTELAAATRFDFEEVCASIEPLYSAALLGERTDEPLSAMLFYEHVRHCGTLWQGMNSTPDPLPELITSGQANAKLVLGILIEEWHYVASNPLHASTAVLNARSPRTRQLWAEFAAEEYAHGAWLEEGLAHIVSREDLRRCRPLPGTAALCSQLRWTAHANELGYAACLALCEQSNDSQSATFQRDYYASLKRLAVLPDEVFEPYERHALTDVEACHLDFTRVPFEEQGTLTLDERLDVLGHVWDHVQTYQLFYRNIVEYHGSPDTPRIYGVPVATSTPELPLSLAA